MCSSHRGKQLDYAARLLLHAADSHQQMDAQSQLRQLGYRLQEAGWLGIFGVSTSVAQSAPGDDWSVPPFAIPSGDQTWEWKIPNLVRWFSHSTSILRDFPAVPGTVPGAKWILVPSRAPVEAGAASKVAVPGDLLQQAAGLIQQVVEEIEWIDCCWVTNGGGKVGRPEVGRFTCWVYGMGFVDWMAYGGRVIDVLTFGALSSDKPHTMPWRQDAQNCQA